MGKKLDEAYYRLTTEARHTTKLAQARGSDHDLGVAEGFAEALRIVNEIRSR